MVRSPQYSSSLPNGRAASAGRIGTEQIRAVVDHTDMLAVVGEVVDLKKAGPQAHKGLCPFHTEKTPSFHVNAALHVYHCKGCGAGGDVISFVRQTRGLSFVEAVQWLADRAGIELQRQELSPAEQARWDADRSQRARLLELAKSAQQFFRARFGTPDGKAAHDYAASRGLGQAIAVRYGLGAAGTGWSDLCDHLRRLGWHDGDLLDIGLAVERQGGGVYDRFRNRLMFPIFTAQGDLIAFGGRDLSGEHPAKYLNSPEVNVAGEGQGSRFYHFYKKGDVVFGLYQAREAIRKSGQAILVEGNLDVMTLAQAGFENAVCAMGTALTETQARQIQRFAGKLVLLYDGDNAGRAAAQKAVPTLLSAGCNGVLVTLPDGEDPDSFVRKFGAEALHKLIAAAPPMLNAHLDTLVGQWDGSLQGKAQILQVAAPLLAAMGHHDTMARQMAYDYLISRIDPSAPLDASRDAEGRYYPRPPAVSRAPAPPPASESARVEEDALELFQALVHYPSLLGNPALADAVDVIGDADIRLALRDMLAVHRDSPLDMAGVAHWALQSGDPAVRERVLDWLNEPPPTTAAKAAHHVATLADRMVVSRTVDSEMQTVAERLRQAPAAERAELTARLFELRKIKAGAHSRAAAVPRH